MRTRGVRGLERRLSRFDGVPSGVVSGNGAAPWLGVDAIDRSIESYRLYILNAAAGVPERPGVIAETSFVGPGMRRHPAL